MNKIEEITEKLGEKNNHRYFHYGSVQFSSVTQSCLTLCEPMDYSMQGFPSHYHLPAAAAAAKSLQSCLTLCDPRGGSPLGFSVPRILQARILEWGAISFSIPSP